MSLLPAVLLLSASTLACSATIHRFDYQGYHVLVTKGPDSVGLVDRHRRKYVKNWDDGTPIDCRLVRACYRRRGGRNPVIVISERHIGCLSHELCHLDEKDEAYCAKHYPCVADIK